MNIISVKNLNKIYQSGEQQLQVLNDVSFDMEEGKSYAITGPSGSGKTTLLGLLAGMDSLTSGSINIKGNELATLNEAQRTELRLNYMGFVFQNFQLLPNLTALENVMIPLQLKGSKNEEKSAKEFLDQVGLSKRYQHYPAQLSGGEQQRVAIARAFSNHPKILLADEPTGNLDESTSEQIENLLFSLNNDKGTTLIIVTHDMNLAAKTHKIFSFKNGSLE